MHAEIFAVVGVLLLALVLGFLFTEHILIIGINGILLYLGILRAYAELQAGRERYYAYAVIPGIGASLLLPHSRYIWKVTWFLAITILLVQIFWYVGPRIKQTFINDVPSKRRKGGR